MSIDPKVGFWLNVILVGCTALAGLAWSTVLDTSTATVISFSLLGLSTVLNAVLHGFSSPQQGPLVKP